MASWSTCILGDTLIRSPLPTRSSGHVFADQQFTLLCHCQPSITPLSGSAANTSVNRCVCVANVTHTDESAVILDMTPEQFRGMTILTPSVFLMSDS